jgi:hypothetical protein
VAIKAWKNTTKLAPRLNVNAFDLPSFRLTFAIVILIRPGKRVVVKATTSPMENEAT